MVSNQLQSFLAELRRRRVPGVAALYLVGAWLAIQVCATVFPYIGLPPWTVTAVIAAAALGMPLALVLAWAFQVEAAGITRDTGAPSSSRAGRWYRMVTVVVVLALVTIAGISLPRLLTRAPLESVAVLPFADLSEQRDQEYFAHGIAEELLEALAQVDGLRVPGRTSAFRFRDETRPVQEIARELGVASVLHGSVRRVRDQVRINVQLIDAKTGYRLWSESYDRQVADIFAVQDEIAREVVAALRLRLAPEQRAAVSVGGTDDPEAHAHYLRGLHAWNRRLATSLHAAIGHYRAALERDPRYPGAWSALAEAYAIMPEYEGSAPGEWFQLSEVAARRALALDSTLAAPYATLGYLYGKLGREREARAMFERSLALNPRYATARQWYGMHLSFLGRAEEALVQFSAAQAADPLAPIVALNLGIELYHARRPDSAAAVLKQITATDPTFGVAHAHLARVLSHLGRHEEAAGEARRALEILGGEGHGRALVAAGYALARAGEREAAQALSGELERRATEGNRNPGWLGVAALRLALADTADAVRLYERGRARGDIYPTHSPEFDVIRERAAGRSGTRP